jgi:hypothetical protein
MPDTQAQDYRASDADQLDASDAPGVLTVGLVPSPGQCERVTRDIAGSLPDVLAENVDGDATWELKVVADPLTGSNIETPRLLDEVEDWQAEHGWDFAIAITDLPVHEDDRIVVAEASSARHRAWISIPPLGVIHLRHRVRAMLVELVDEMHWGEAGAAGKTSAGRKHREHPKISARIAREVEPTHDERGVDIRYVAPPLTGHLRLLAGMVYANRPWTLFPSFKTTIATAFATGGSGLIFSTLWKLGNIYEIWRLILLMVVAMGILIGWIIISHGLWEPQRDASSHYLTTLYNSATLLTITTGVVFAYALVFVMLLSAALVYIPNPMLEQTIQQPVTPASFLRIAWITASVATIAGAVGAGLEDTDAVREATFGWRQHHRFEEYEHAWGDESDTTS